MRTEHRILAIAIVLGFSFWIIDAAVDSLFYYDESFLESLFVNVAGVEFYMRSLVIILLLAFGVIVSRMFSRQKRIREKLRASEQQSAILLEQVSDAIIIADVEGKLLDANKRAVELFGYSKDELLNLSFSERHPQEELERISEAFRDTIKRGSGVLHNTAILRKDGTIAEVEIIGSIIQFEDKRLVRAFLRDITEGRRGEEKIRDIAEGVSAETSDRFFHSLVRHLSRILGMEYSFVGALNNEEFEQVEVIAVCAHGDIIDNFTYDLAHTPCENVAGKDLCIYPREVQKQFPKDHMLKDMNAECYFGIPLFSSKGLPLGIMAVLGCQPMKNTQLVTYTLQVFATRVAAELERKQAEETLRQSESTLRELSAQLLSAQEDERARLAADLHDEVGQTVGSIKVRVETLLKKATMSGGKIDAKSLKGLVPIIKTAMEEIRNICTDLRPSTLDSLGLIATIKWLCREFNSSYEDISVELSIAIQEDRVPQSLRVPIFRILQESLNNITKHSEADSVQIYLGLQDGHIRLTIEDNGSGVDLKNLLSLEDGRRGFGIPSMRQRTEYSGGSFSIESMEGKGTSVQVSWPITA